MKCRFALFLLGVFLLAGSQCLSAADHVKVFPGQAVLSTVRGTSLVPLVNPGDTVRIIKGMHYRPETGHIVVCTYSGNENPVIKMVKGVPGDRFQILKGESEDFYRIYVNGGLLKNTEGKPYRLTEKRARLLKLYAGKYSAIPKDTYLLMGNVPSGSLDATRFGLIDRNQIMGKVEIVDKVQK